MQPEKLLLVHLPLAILLLPLVVLLVPFEGLFFPVAAQFGEHGVKAVLGLRAASVLPPGQIQNVGAEIRVIAQPTRQFPLDRFFQGFRFHVRLRMGSFKLAGLACQVVADHLLPANDDAVVAHRSRPTACVGKPRRAKPAAFAAGRPRPKQQHFHRLNIPRCFDKRA